jgi:succinate dehydrogenase / fumarate reductase cytochrome b subunit
MAVTGLILVIFVIFHLLGNLQIYNGPEGLNGYSRLLRVEPLLLWIVRLVLLAAAVLHVYFGVVLWLESRRARPVGYAYMRTVKASLASRTMIYSGIIVMGFIIYHLLHLTFGVAGPVGYQFEHSNVYRNVVRGFSDPLISILYIVGQLLLFFHLSHGIQSAFQSLGFRHPKYLPAVQRGGTTLAFLLAAGNIAIPLAVLFHMVR